MNGKTKKIICVIVAVAVVAAVVLIVVLNGRKRQDAPVSEPTVTEETMTAFETEPTTEEETTMESTTEELTTREESTQPVVQEPEDEIDTNTTVPQYDSDFAMQIGGRIDKDMVILHLTEQDFNGDGKTEAFAVVVQEKKSNAMPMDERKLEYWFYSKNVSKKLFTFDATMGMGFPTETMQLDDSGKHMAWVSGVGPSPAGGHYIYSTYAVNRSGEPVLLLKSNQPLERLSDGAFQLLEQDMTYCRTTIFTYDTRKCTLVESEPVQITQEEFSRLQGSQDILAQIQKDGGKVAEIFYRSPGVVSVNSGKKDGSQTWYSCFNYIVTKDGTIEPTCVGEGTSLDEPLAAEALYGDDEAEQYAITVEKTKKFPY